MYAAIRSIFPLVARSVTIELDADTIWIAEIDRLRHTMVTCTFERITSIEETLDDFREFES